MGLTDRHKTTKKLVDSRKNRQILTVSRKQGQKELTVKEIVPRVVNFKEGAKPTYGCVIYFPATLTPYARQAKRFLVVTLTQAPFPPLSRGTNFFHSENLASCWGLKFAIFRRSCLRNTSEATPRDVTVCKTRCR